VVLEAGNAGEVGLHRQVDLNGVGRADREAGNIEIENGAAIAAGSELQFIPPLIVRIVMDDIVIPHKCLARRYVDREDFVEV
jgi:hypothetical protein